MVDCVITGDGKYIQIHNFNWSYSSAGVYFCPKSGLWGRKKWYFLWDDHNCLFRVAQPNQRVYWIVKSLSLFLFWCFRLNVYTCINCFISTKLNKPVKVVSTTQLEKTLKVRVCEKKRTEIDATMVNKNPITSTASKPGNRLMEGKAIVGRVLTSLYPRRWFSHVMKVSWLQLVTDGEGWGVEKGGTLTLSEDIGRTQTAGFRRLQMASEGSSRVSTPSLHINGACCADDFISFKGTYTAYDIS